MEKNNVKTKPKPIPKQESYLTKMKAQIGWNNFSASSDKNAKRIAGLIDLHLGRLAQPNTIMKSDVGFMGFEIGEYLG